MAGRAIGIDLGSYNSAAAVALEGSSAWTTVMIPSHYGPTNQGTVFPSFVKFDAAGEYQKFGEEARQDLGTAPRQVAWGVKRLLGRTFGEINENDRGRFLYPMEQGEDGSIAIRIGAKAYAPADISTIILEKMRIDAEDRALQQNPVACPVSKVVITRPAYFTHTQVEETREAAQNAGFEEIELVSEPEAAALAYGVELDATKTQFVMTIDWGAGTLDVVVSGLTVGWHGGPILHSISPPCGDTRVGGIDMDDALVKRALDLYGMDALRGFMEALQGGRVELEDAEWMAAYRDLADLRFQVERAKIEVSSRCATTVWASYQGKPLELKMAATKHVVPDGESDWIVVEDQLPDHLNRLEVCVRRALKESGLEAKDIGRLLLVGGPMHMPCVLGRISHVFADNKPVCDQLEDIATNGFHIDPMEAVAKGAALYAVREQIKDILTPHESGYPVDYGILLRSSWGVEQGQILIKRQDAKPTTSLPLALGCRGAPGDSIPVSLFQRDPEHATYSRIGKYDFCPCYLGGKASFSVTLESDNDGGISAVFQDKNSGGELRLVRLNKENAGGTTEPLPFGDGSQDETQQPGGGEEQGLVPADKVARVRNRSKSFLDEAKAAFGTGGLTADVATELTSRCDALNGALVQLPPGDAQQGVYQQVHILHTELLNCLVAHGLHSEGAEELM